MNLSTLHWKSGRFVLTRGTLALTLAMLVCLVLAIWSFTHIESVDKQNKQQLLQLTEQQILAIDIPRLSTRLVRGDAASAKVLTEIRGKLSASLQLLEAGDPQRALKPVHQSIRPGVDQLRGYWNRLDGILKLLLDNQASFKAAGNYQADIAGNLDRLLEQSAKLVASLRADGSTGDQIYWAERQSSLLLQVQLQLERLSAIDGSSNLQTDETGAVAETAVRNVDLERFTSNVDEFTRVLNGFVRGDGRLGIDRIEGAASKPLLQEVVLLTKSLRESVSALAGVYPKIDETLQALAQVEPLVKQLVAHSRTSASLIQENAPGRFSLLGVKVSPALVFLLSLAALGFLVLLFFQILLEAQRREKESNEQNEANQKAILRLLDEMGDLADGDLTVTATVTEDITGAIADSINYAIEALRNLVTTINMTSEQVSSSAKDTRATATHLAEASELQAEQISMATQAIRDMTKAVERMSTDAAESVQVASRSVEIATKGSEKVRSTIRSMDAIRDQIQETSKRIKRLGESSQEIGDIVELIDDIADQTNILALNAAMQAAMAGEAGRGFAVVADEVQRLAERSGNATKQIEALVKAIQADTNEAVRSMETSTAGVVRGAKQSEEAGEALKEIESVSNYLADMTRQIADSAQVQSSEAARVDDTMNVIQEITTQTADGTNQTAASIGILADLADDLRRSVAGFRLPDVGGGTITSNEL